MTWQLASFAILGVGLAGGFAWYERSRPSARVLALVAALAALAVVGRLAFAAFPNVKPTTDIVLLAGYALGGAPGFMVGAITPVVSNVFMGHGPWTPWQMAAWGRRGDRRGGASARDRRAAAGPLAARDRVRGRRCGLRRRDGHLSVDARRAAGPRDVDRGQRHVAPVQPRARRRKRRLLPVDRPRAAAGAVALPAPVRGALGARGCGIGRSAAVAGAAERRPGRLGGHARD